MCRPTMVSTPQQLQCRYKARCWTCKASRRRSNVLCMACKNAQHVPHDACHAACMNASARASTGKGIHAKHQEAAALHTEWHAGTPTTCIWHAGNLSRCVHMTCRNGQHAHAHGMQGHSARAYANDMQELSVRAAVHASCLSPVVTALPQ
jgi:hypothetical protein